MGVAVLREAGVLPVRHRTPLEAVVVVAFAAVDAVPAVGEALDRHVVADLETGHAFTELDDHPRGLMAQGEVQ